MASNPFTPSFGVSPPLLVGRDAELEAVAESLDGGPGSPARATLFTGVRGCGKTALLNAVEDLARNRGWLVVSETVRPGVAQRIADTHLTALLAQHTDEAVRRRLTQASASVFGVGGGVTRHHEDRHPVAASLRSRLDELTEAIAPRGSGVLISLDEVHRSAITDLRELAHTVQHAFREGREVALVAAGLPSAVTDLLNDDVLTFLRRAERFTLGKVPASDVARALREPIESSGRAIGDDALSLAVEGTQRYPFLVQLVGFHSWRADPGSTEVTAEHVREGIERSVRRVGHLVHEPALSSLSAVDKSFLAAMAVDDGPSAMGVIAQRLGVDATYASQYRLRLIAAELIEPVGHGKVDFTLPYVRDYLREHAATEALGPL
ncbi:AAA ATPase domain-containing protein [Quadrisphaera granulorum]|uniref:AAA ATPase-like protein n=1 Tax=Quadrisphaera granulorum TaxID=317664 RepID=A0A316ADF3_9ACTN|nr:ATP-binding protein [Quadrisphaera granulorum]PWJ55642.1 AAA ATPase-like protein [Quadrisphaera granulorum]SZE95139.1 AAA ATPase domain-containing protein [Quadrisphaera granulorum]